MKPTTKQTRTPRRSKSPQPRTRPYEVPSHGRLARRGSTEVVEDVDAGRRGLRERPTDPSS